MNLMNHKCFKEQMALYANVNNPVKLKGKPVLSDKEFNKLKNSIINTK